MRRHFLLAAACLFLCCSAAFAAQFVDLGPGRTTGMAPIGNIAVAYNNAATGAAMVWSPQYGSVSLGTGTTAGCAWKGSTLVVGGLVGGVASRWVGSAQGMGSWSSLPLANGTYNWTPLCTGANAGDVYIGGYATYGGYDRATRYKESVSSSTVVSLPSPNGRNPSRVLGVASNQDLFAGQANYGYSDGSGAYNAWAGQPGGVSWWYNTFSGPPSTSQTARIVAVSGDGSRMVGRSGGAGWGACYWDSPTSIVQIPLGSITADYGQANAVSYDGSYIAGIYRVSTSNPTRRAFIWDAVNGTRDLETVLTAAGIDLTGWQLMPQSDIAPFSWYGVTGISSDGKWISGIGLKNGVETGWVAFIPEPSSLWVLGVGLLALYRRRR